jgi:hypothetical protein
MAWETEIDDVVAGQPIESVWGNEIRDKVVHIVASPAALPTDVPDGGLAYTQSDDKVYVRQAGQWNVVTTGGLLSRAVKTATQTGITTTEVDISGLSISVTIPNNRVIRLSAFATFTPSSADGYARMLIRRSADLIVRGHTSTFTTTSTSADQYVYLSVLVFEPAGTYTYRMTAARVLGTAASTVALVAATSQPAYIAAEDLGSW